MQRREFDREEMIDGILAREGRRLPENPPPGDKWKAMEGVARLNLGAAGDVLRCLIDCASKESGACYPSEEFIAGWLDRPVATIKRQVKALKKKKLVTVIDRRRENKSNVYLINWPLLFDAQRALKAFQKNRRTTAQKCDV